MRTRIHVVMFRGMLRGMEFVLQATVGTVFFVLEKFYVWMLREVEVRRARKHLRDLARKAGVRGSGPRTP